MPMPQLRRIKRLNFNLYINGLRDFYNLDLFVMSNIIYLSNKLSSIFLKPILNFYKALNYG